MSEEEVGTIEGTQTERSSTEKRHKIKGSNKKTNLNWTKNQQPHKQTVKENNQQTTQRQTTHNQQS